MKKNLSSLFLHYAKDHFDVTLFKNLVLHNTCCRKINLHSGRIDQIGLLMFILQKDPQLRGMVVLPWISARELQLHLGGLNGICTGPEWTKNLSKLSVCFSSCVDFVAVQDMVSDSKKLTQLSVSGSIKLTDHEMISSGFAQFLIKPHGIQQLEIDVDDLSNKNWVYFLENADFSSVRELAMSFRNDTGGPFNLDHIPGQTLDRIGARLSRLSSLSLTCVYFSEASLLRLLAPMISLGRLTLGATYYNVNEIQAWAKERYCRLILLDSDRLPMTMIPVSERPIPGSTRGAFYSLDDTTSFVTPVTRTSVSHFSGNPEIFGSWERCEVREYDVQAGQYMVRDPHYERIHIERKNPGNPTEPHHYIEAIGIPVGQLTEIPTGSASQVEICWDTKARGAIDPEFYVDRQLGLMAVTIPAWQTDASSISLILYVKNCTPMIRSRDLKAEQCVRQPLNVNLPFVKALEIFQWDDHLRASVDTPSDELFLNLLNYFSGFQSDVLVPWNRLIDLFPKLDELRLSDNDKTVLRCLYFRQGQCRHIAYAANQLLVANYGFSCRVAANPMHAFVEMLLKKVGPNGESYWNELDWSLRWTEAIPGQLTVNRMSEMDIQLRAQTLKPYLDRLDACLWIPELSLSTLTPMNGPSVLCHIPVDFDDSHRKQLLTHLRQVYQRPVEYVESDSGLVTLARCYASMSDVVVVVNWAEFYRDRVASQSILDPTPTLNGVPFSSFQIWSLVSPTTFSGVPGDFRDRHKVSISLVGLSTLSESVVSIVDDPDETVNLVDGAIYWKTLLFGTISPKINMAYEEIPGVLSRYLDGGRIRIINPPRCREFELEIERVLRNRYYLSMKSDGQYHRFPISEAMSIDIDLTPMPTPDILPISVKELERLSANSSEGQTVWVVTAQNFSLYLGHQWCAPTAVLELQRPVPAQPSGHEGFASLIKPSDWVVFYPEVTDAMKQYFLGQVTVGVSRFRNVDVALIADCHEQLPVKYRRFDVASEGSGDLLSSINYDGAQFAVTMRDLWHELGQSMPVVVFGLTVDPPLYDALVIAQKTGVLLVPGTRIAVTAPLYLMSYRPWLIPSDEHVIASDSTPEMASQLVMSVLKSNAVVIFKGYPDSGKSHLVGYMAKTGLITPYFGLNSVVSWRASRNPHSTLIIEEFDGMADGQLNHLIGDIETVCQDGGHNIILVGNGVAQIGRRATVIETYGSVIQFEEPSIERVVESAIELIGTNSQFGQFAGPIFLSCLRETLAEFGSFVRSQYSEIRRMFPCYSFSFRNAHTIAMNGLVAWIRDPKSDASQVSVSIRQMGVAEVDYVFNAVKMGSLLYHWGAIDFGEGVHSTIFAHLSRMLTPRDYFGGTIGKIGILFEGKSGVGKSYVVRNVLEKWIMPQGHSIGFRVVELSSEVVGLARAAIIECAINGDIAVVEEFNTNPGLIEDIMCELMSSGTTGSTYKVHPNFRFVVIQNSPIENIDRQPIPDCSVSRFQCVRLPDVMTDDVGRILSDLETDAHETENWHSAYCLRPLATPRLLRHALEKIRKKGAGY